MFFRLSKLRTRWFNSFVLISSLYFEIQAFSSKINALFYYSRAKFVPYRFFQHFLVGWSLPSLKNTLPNPRGERKTFQSLWLLSKKYDSQVKFWIVTCDNKYSRLWQNLIWKVQNLSAFETNEWLSFANSEHFFSRLTLYIKQLWKWTADF